MNTLGVIVLAAAALYAAFGMLFAIAFVSSGVTRVPEPARVSWGARIVLIPGAAALWPFVLRRWLKAGKPA